MTDATARPAGREWPRALLAFALYFAALVAAWWLAERFLPDRLEFAVLGHAFEIANVHQHIVNVCIVGFLVAPLIFAAELVLVGWNGSSLRHFVTDRSASSRADLVTFLLWQCHAMNYINIALTFGGGLISGAWLHDWINETTGVNLTLDYFSLPVQCAGYFLLYTFFDYWTHRLDHSRYFWPLHRYHHSADEMYILTSTRVHPVNFSGIFFMILPLGLFDASPTLIFGVSLFIGGLRLLIHSRIDSNFGWIGRYIVQSPVDHRLHHALESVVPDGACNYSLFPVWDHLFGTWRDGGHQRIRMGVSHPYRQGAWVFPDLWRDYRDFLAGLRLAKSARISQ